MRAIDHPPAMTARVVLLGTSFNVTRSRRSAMAVRARTLLCASISRGVSHLTRQTPRMKRQGGAVLCFAGRYCRRPSLGGGGAREALAV